MKCIKFSLLSHDCRTILTVRLLVARTSTRSSKFLGFTTARICNQQSPIVLDQNILDLFLGSFINICLKTKSLQFKKLHREQIYINIFCIKTTRSCTLPLKATTHTTIKITYIFDSKPPMLWRQLDGQLSKKFKKKKAVDQ